MEDTCGGLSAQAFGNSMQDLGNAGRGRFEAVECRVPACRELMVAGLAVEILDGVVLSMVAVADEGVNGRVGNVVVITDGVGTGLAAGVNVLLATARALSLGIRHDDPSRCCRWGAGRGSAV